jgi:hypothetical protein
LGSGVVVRADVLPASRLGEGNVDLRSTLPATGPRHQALTEIN